MDRREFLKYLGIAVAGAAASLGLSYYLSKLEKLSKVTKLIYGGNNPANATETVTITVTKTATNSQAPQTYTTTKTVTETVTKTETTTVTQAPQTYTTTTTTQPPQNLEDILFGNSDKQFILLELTDAKIDNNIAYQTVVDYLTKTELQIELPIQYVSNGKISIKDLLSIVNNYNSAHGTNYKVYLVLGRANINQAIQQNGKWNLPAPQIYYNIIISDRGWEDVYNALQNLWNGNTTVAMPTLWQGPYANSSYAWINGIGSIIIVYQDRQQVDSVVNSINLANSILGTPNNPNPSSQGIVHVVTIADIQKAGVYENKYPVDEVKNYLGTYIVFMQEQGNQLFSNL